MYSIISANSHWSLEWILVSLEVICHRPNPVFEGMLLLFRSLISLTPLRIPLKETFGITLNTVFMTLTLACLCKVGYCSLLRNHCYGAQIYSWDETVHIQYWASSSFPGDRKMCQWWWLQLLLCLEFPKPFPELLIKEYTALPISMQSGVGVAWKGWLSAVLMYRVTFFS